MMNLRIFAAVLLVAVAIQAASVRRVRREAIAFDCTNKADGDYADPYSKCSTFFYKCSAIGPTLHACPNGTAYDTNLRICNWVDWIPECKSSSPGQSTIASTTVQQNPPTTTAPNGLQSFSCSQNPSASNASLFFDCYQIPNLRASLLAFDCIERPGTAQPGMNVFDCFQKTIGGGNSVPIPVQCRRMAEGSFSCKHLSGLGTGFDCHVSGQRVNPSGPLAFGCSQTGITTTASTTTTKTTTKQADVPQFDCLGKPSGNYPLGPCENHFWQCSNGVSFKMPCATLQQRYNPATDRCLDPIDVAGCRTSIPLRKRRELTDNQLCAGKPDGDYPMGQCMDLFLTCSNNQATENQCAEGTVFDSRLKRCEWEDSVLECKQPLANDIASLNTTFSCEGKESGSYANPDAKCSRYFFKCANGQMSQEWCPADLMFDPSLGVCNYANLMHC